MTQPIRRGDIFTVDSEPVRGSDRFITCSPSSRLPDQPQLLRVNNIRLICHEPCELVSQPAELPQPIHRLRDLARRRLRILCGDGVEALAEGFGRHGAVVA